MWEITLVGKPSDIGYFLELKDILKRKFDKNVIIVISLEKDLVCSIATNKYIDFLETKKFKTIIKIVKAEYYESKLTIFTDDKSLNAFILSSLILINLSDEVEYSKEFVSLSKLVNIRSYVYFKLHKLIEIWSREIEYYNYTFSGKFKEDLYLEFLRFLAQNSNAKLDIMYLEENENEMILFDKRKNAIKIISKRDEIGIIVQLIMFAPKKIIINCLGSLSKKVSNLISYIFEDRVSVLL